MPGAPNKAKRINDLHRWSFFYAAQKVAQGQIRADLLNDRVLPFYAEYDLPVLRILTDRGTEYCAKADSQNSAFLKPSVLKALGLSVSNIYDPYDDRYLDDASYHQLINEDPSREVIIFIPENEAWIPHWLRIPNMIVASDSMWNYDTDWDTPIERFRGHPRTSGTHARVLELGREHQIPLTFSLSQMSFWPAKHMGDLGLEAMRERGRLQVGKIADITIFDPNTVRARSTYRSGEQGMSPHGIPWVIVHGDVVVRNSMFQKVWSGQAIRFPVQPGGKFVPLDDEVWPYPDKD